MSGEAKQRQRNRIPRPDHRRLILRWTIPIVIAIAGIALVVFGWLLAPERELTFDELSAAAEAEQAASREKARLDREQRLERERGRQEDAEKAAAEKTAADLAARDAELKRLRDFYGSMKAEERVAAVRGACAGESCDYHRIKIIIESAPEAEKASLRSFLSKLESEAEQDKDPSRVRERFVAYVDIALKAEGLKPERVRAVGPDKTTLRVEGLFCTRQFLKEFAASELGKIADIDGFNKIQCTNGTETWTGDFFERQ